MATMANSGALGTAAERVGEAASATFVNILVNVLGSCPGKAAGVVTAGDEEG